MGFLLFSREGCHQILRVYLLAFSEFNTLFFFFFFFFLLLFLPLMLHCKLQCHVISPIFLIISLSIFLTPIFFLSHQKPVAPYSVFILFYFKNHEIRTLYVIIELYMIYILIMLRVK